MADLTTIPTQDGTEILRALMTVTASGAGGTNLLASAGDVAITGDSEIGPGFEFDGLKPYGGAEIRLRRVGGSYQTFSNDNPTARLAIAVPGDAEGWREGVKGSAGPARWNWTFPGGTGWPATFIEGDALLLVLWTPPAAVVDHDTAAAVEGGAPGVSAAAEVVAAPVGPVVDHDASAGVEGGAAGVEVAVEVQPVGDADTDAAVAAGVPDVAVEVLVLPAPPPPEPAPPRRRLTQIQQCILLAGVWLPRRSALEAVLPVEITCEDSAEGLVVDLARTLADRVEGLVFGESCLPDPALPTGTISPDEAPAGSIVVALDPNQAVVSYGDAGPAFAPIRVHLVQKLTRDVDDADGFIRTRQAVTLVLERLSGVIGT